MAEKIGKRYPKDIKESLIKRMMPPNNEAISHLSEEVGITEATLYKWRKEARVTGMATLGDGQGSKNEDKFLIVMETIIKEQNIFCSFMRRVNRVQAWRPATSRW